MRQLLYIILFVTLGITLLSLMGFMVYEHGRQPVQEIKIKISKTENGGFLNQERIYSSILELNGMDTVMVSDFDEAFIENKLRQNPYIAHADAYININRELILNIKEREALFRIYLPDNSSFYVDTEGNLFPLCDWFTPRLLIANGYINALKPEGLLSIQDSVYAETELPELYELVKKITLRPFLNSQISQIYVNSKGEFDLIPELGSHSIRLGQMDYVDEKLRNLETFYRKKLVTEGWDKYEIINLMYTNQIVCTKK